MINISSPGTSPVPYTFSSTFLIYNWNSTFSIIDNPPSTIENATWVSSTSQEAYKFGNKVHLSSITSPSVLQSVAVVIESGLESLCTRYSLSRIPHRFNFGAPVCAEHYRGTSCVIGCRSRITCPLNFGAPVCVEHCCSRQNLSSDANALQLGVRLVPS